MAKTPRDWSCGARTRTSTSFSPTSFNSMTSILSTSGQAQSSSNVISIQRSLSTSVTSTSRASVQTTLASNHGSVSISYLLVVGLFVVVIAEVCPDFARNWWFSKILVNTLQKNSVRGMWNPRTQAAGFLIQFSSRQTDFLQIGRNRFLLLNACPNPVPRKPLQLEHCDSSNCFPAHKHLAMDQSNLIYIKDLLSRY